MPGENPQVGQIAGEDGPARLGNGCDKRVDRGPGASPGSQPGGPAGERDGKVFSDIAGTQEAVFRRVPGSLTGEAFDQYHRGNHRRPQTLGAEGRYQRGGTGRAFRQTRDRTGIQDQHSGPLVSAGPRGAPGGDPPRYSLGAGLFLL